MNMKIETNKITGAPLTPRQAAIKEVERIALHTKNQSVKSVMYDALKALQAIENNDEYQQCTACGRYNTDDENLMAENGLSYCSPDYSDDCHSNSMYGQEVA
jgi:hypothetical protein